jgi:hypothetical protein
MRVCQLLMVRSVATPPVSNHEAEIKIRSNRKML